MTFKYNNVYLKETSTVAGPYEKQGPIKKHFDKTYNDLYFKTSSWEKAEIKLVQKSLEILLKKINKKPNEIDVVIGGDLLNQITATSYGVLNTGKSFLGIYNACATSVEGLIIASSLIDSKKISNAIVTTSSHNMSSEKQFRNPTEYGAPRPRNATFTSTGSASAYLTKEKTNIKIESSTIGKIIDLNQNDPNNMGKVMAPAAIDIMKRHFDDLKRTPNYYDLIVTGDLGIYGKEIVIDYMLTMYDIDLRNNYNDTGVMLYNQENQEYTLAGGSGPACCPLVTYSYIIDQLRIKKLKKVLIIATGALFSPTMIFQKQNIPSIAHAISLEVVE